MKEFKEYKLIFIILFLFIMAVLVCRITMGLGVSAILIAGIYFLRQKKIGCAIFSYMSIMFMTNLSPFFIQGAFFSIVARVSLLTMTLMLILDAPKNTGKDYIPLGWLYPYLFVATLSSIDGYFPMISYLKIINFMIFLTGLYWGTRKLYLYPEDIEIIRSGIMAFAIFVIFGSVAVLPFPSIGYSMVYRKAINMGFSGSVESYISHGQGHMFYSGVLSHSQTLAPFIVAIAAWVLCDMIFNERRFTKLHLSLLVVAPFLLFKTRSRIGLLGFCVMLLVVYFYALPFAKIPTKIRKRLEKLMLFCCIIAVIIGTALEYRNNTFSRWLRKTDDIASDKREIGDALTYSRQDSITMNMSDFNKNRLLGMGFQTSADHPALYRAGYITLYSAPIEKGILPLMILGETGIVGAIMFLFFLVRFYVKCNQKKYTVTSALFTVLLFLNMAEAFFFSPTGPGGSFWMILVLGGFSIDICILSRIKQDRYISMETKKLIC